MSAKTPERPVTGWPLAKAGHTPRVLHKRSKTFHEASTPVSLLFNVSRSVMQSKVLADRYDIEFLSAGIAQESPHEARSGHAAGASENQGSGGGWQIGLFSLCRAK